MVEGRSRVAWSHTSAVLCLLANIHRGKGQTAYTPADFDPHRRERESEVKPIMGVEALRMFLGGNERG